MTTSTQTLWSWANLCSGRGLSRKQLAQLQSRNDGPTPVRIQDDGQPVFDADELCEWVDRVRPGLKR